MKSRLDVVRTFYDPHPGFGGAAILIPTMVKKVAEKLDGKSMTLREAVVKIQKVTKGKVRIRKNWISLELEESDTRRHMFRVIRFKYVS
jgi:hypothetical protein